MNWVDAIIEQVHANGYAVMRRLEPWLTTEEVAQAIGSLMDVSKFLPGVPKVQTLRPRKPSPDLMNQYSGTYGTGEFPLHSDLAHWNVPPRYLLLRCKVGTDDVSTTILPYAAIAAAVGERTLSRALVVPRLKAKQQIRTPLSVAFRHEGIWGIRWDFLFLQPLNDAARDISSVLSTCCWSDGQLISANLTEPADTVILDNWRVLHGRAAVSDRSMHREIQRTYLDRIGD